MSFFLSFLQSGDNFYEFLSASVKDKPLPKGSTLNLFAFRMAKTLWSFGHSECKRVECKSAILRAKG